MFIRDSNVRRIKENSMWIIIKNNIPIGIYSTEEKAKGSLPEGEYYLIPIEENQLYDSLLDIGLPGAIMYTKQGVDHYVETLNQQITELNVKIEEKETKITALDDRIKIIEEKEYAPEREILT